jgi:SRSO17 transposase
LNVNPIHGYVEKKPMEETQQPQSGLQGIAQRFVAWCERYGRHFDSQTRQNEVVAQQYLRGLMQAEKKNMERMEEVVPEADEQALQHFISSSPWDDVAVREQLGRDADRLLGDEQDACVLVDESGFPKKGTQSVGVGRQWCGQVGKVENCQVGVYVALVRGGQSVLLDTRLYLPHAWTDDPLRCREAGVPEKQIAFTDKTDLALELVQTVRRRGIRFGWVAVDGLYGQDLDFLQHLEDAGEVFVADVHCTQQVYLEDPTPVIPERQGTVGRLPTKRVTPVVPMRVDQWAAQQPLQAWTRLTLRATTKGELRVDLLSQRVWVWDKRSATTRYWHLIVRREVASPETIKYGLSNASAETSLQRLGFMQAQRVWVERDFQDGKQEAGLGDYQVRGWRGWHHHMTLVMLCMLFLLEERFANQATTPLLSCADIRILLAHFLPRRDVTLDEVLRQMEKRHKKRQAAIQFAYKKQQQQLREVIPKLM